LTFILGLSLASSVNKYGEKFLQNTEDYNTVNNRPIVGVVSQPLNGIFDKLNDTKFDNRTSYIAASYIQYI
jgi:hypothetical protein